MNQDHSNDEESYTPYEKKTENHGTVDLTIRKNSESKSQKNPVKNKKKENIHIIKEVNMKEDSLNPSDAQGHSNISSKRVSNAEENLYNEDKRNPVKLIIVKLVVILIAFGLFFLFKQSSSIRGINPASNDDCITDRGLDLFSPINAAIHSHKNRKKRTFIQIMSSEQIDMAFLTMSFLW